jgi:uncharacterized damage-inducible protein DinB
MSIAILLKEFDRHFAYVDHAISQVDDEQFVSSTGGNPVTSQLAHLSGFLRSRLSGFLTEDQEKPWRDRHAEFTALATKDKILPLWEEAKSVVRNEVGALTESDLQKTVHFRGQPGNAGETLVQLLTHVVYHAAQIVLLARQATGDSWKPIGSTQTHAPAVATP